MPTNNSTGYFKSGISIYGNQEETYYQNQANAEENDNTFNDAPPPTSPVATIANLLGKALERLPAYEPMMQSAQDAPQEIDASPKRFQDYLQEFLVADSTWKAPKREKVDMALHVVQQALPEALIADTTNQHVSPFVRDFMLKDHTSLAAVQAPDPKTPAIHNPSTKGIPTPLERQGQQWFNPEALQAQAPQAIETFQNPPQRRQTARQVSSARYSQPPWSAEQQQADLMRDLLIGHQQMLARGRNQAVINAGVDSQTTLNEAGIRQQELLKQIDAMLNPENGEKPIEVALWNEPTTGADVQHKLPATSQPKITMTKEMVFNKTGLDVKNPVLSAVFGSRTVLPESVLSEKLKNITPQQWREMQIAGQLNKVLTANEKLGKYRNDAKAVAEGFQIIANANTQNGKLNVQGFRNDLAKFFIDQPYRTAKAPSTWIAGFGANYLHGVTESPLASKLFGYNRSQSHGWNERFVEFGNRNANQAHHLAAFVIAGIDNDLKFAKQEARSLDRTYAIGSHVFQQQNEADILLGKQGAETGNFLKTGQLQSSNVSHFIYHQIKK